MNARQHAPAKGNLAPLNGLDRKLPASTSHQQATGRNGREGAPQPDAIVVPKALFPPQGGGAPPKAPIAKGKTPQRSQTPTKQQYAKSAPGQVMVAKSASSPLGAPKPTAVPRAPSTPPPSKGAPITSGREASMKPAVTHHQSTPLPSQKHSTQHKVATATPPRPQAQANDPLDYCTPSPLLKRASALRDKLERFLSPQTPLTDRQGRYGTGPPATASSVASSSDGLTPSRRQQQEWLEILNYIDSVTIAVSSHSKSAPELPGKSLTGRGAGHITAEVGGPISLVGVKATVGAGGGTPSLNNGGAKQTKVKPSTIDASKHLATIQRHISGLLHWFGLLELKSLPRDSNTISDILRNMLLLSTDSISAIGNAQAYILQEAGADGGTQLLQFMKAQIAPVVSECCEALLALYGLAKGYGEIRLAIQHRDAELAMKAIRSSKAAKPSPQRPGSKQQSPTPKHGKSPSVTSTMYSTETAASRLPTVPATYPPTLVEWLEAKWQPALNQWNAILNTAKETFASPEADKDRIQSTASKLKSEVLNDPINTSLLQELLLPGETLPKLVSEHITNPGDGAAMAAAKKASLFKRLQGALVGDSTKTFVELASAIRAIQEAFPEPSGTTKVAPVSSSSKGDAVLSRISVNPTGCDPSKLTSSELKQVEDAQQLLLNIQHAGKATMALTVALKNGPAAASPDQLIRALTEANTVMLKLGVCGGSEGRGTGASSGNTRCQKAIQQGEDMLVALARTDPDAPPAKSTPTDESANARQARRQQLVEQRKAFLSAFSATDLIVVHLPGNGWSPELTMLYHKTGEALATALEREGIRLDAIRQLGKLAKLRPSSSSDHPPQHTRQQRSASSATDLHGVGTSRSVSPPSGVPGAEANDQRRPSAGSTASSRPGTQTTTIALEDLRALVSRSKHVGLENTQELLQIQRMVESAMELRFKVHFDSNIRLLSVPQELVPSTQGVAEQRNVVTAGGAIPSSSGNSRVNSNQGKRSSSPATGGGGRRSNSSSSSARPHSSGGGGSASAVARPEVSGSHYAPPSFERLYDRVYRFCVQGLHNPNPNQPIVLPPPSDLVTPRTVNFRIRYQDADGDFILLASEEDWKVLLGDHFSGAYQVLHGGRIAHQGNHGKQHSHHSQRIELYCDIPALPRQQQVPSSSGQPSQVQVAPQTPTGKASGGVRHGFTPTLGPVRGGGEGSQRGSSRGAVDTGKIKGVLLRGVQGTQLLPPSSGGPRQQTGADDIGNDGDGVFDLPPELDLRHPFPANTPGNAEEIVNRKFSFAVASAPTSKQRGEASPSSQTNKEPPSASEPPQYRQSKMASSAEVRTWANHHNGGVGGQGRDELDLHTVVSERTTVSAKQGSGGGGGKLAVPTPTSKRLSTSSACSVSVVPDTAAVNKEGNKPPINAWVDRHGEEEDLDLHTIVSEKTTTTTTSSRPVGQVRTQHTMQPVPHSTARGWAAHSDDDGFELRTIVSEASEMPPRNGNPPPSTSDSCANQKKQAPLRAVLSKKAVASAGGDHHHLSHTTGQKVKSTSNNRSPPHPSPPTKTKSSHPTPQQPPQLSGNAWADDHGEDNEYDIHTMASVETTETQAWRKDILAQANEVEAELERMSHNRAQHRTGMAVPKEVPKRVLPIPGVPLPNGADGKTGPDTPNSNKKRLTIAEVNNRRAELLAQIRKQKQDQAANVAK